MMGTRQSSGPEVLLIASLLLWPALASGQLASMGAASGLGAVPSAGVGLAAPGLGGGLDAARRGSAEGGMRLTLKLGASVSVIYSSNPGLGAAATSAATTAPEGSSTALQFAPTVNLSLRGPLLSGTVSYAANALAFLDGSSENQVRHTLRSAARLSLADERLALDGGVQITQQSASALGTPAVGGGLLGAGLPAGVGNLANVLSPNQVDLVSMQLSPVLQTRVAGMADAELRYIRTAVERRGRDLPSDGTNRQDADAVQASVSGGEVLRWSAQALEQRQTFSNGRTLEAGRAVAAVAYPVDADLTVRLGAGVERQNLQTTVAEGASTRSTPVKQAGLTWAPSSRTQVAVDVSDRFFGTGWQTAVSHRFNRLSLRLTGSRSVSDGPLSVSTAPGAAGSDASVNVAQLYSRLFAGAEPDPLRRQELVDQALRVRGLNGDSTVSGLAPTFTPSLQNRVEFGLAYVLPRQTFSLLGARTSTERILRDPLNPNDELARFGGLQQTILQAGLTHRLTPESSMGLSWSRLSTEASLGAAPLQLQQWQLNGSFRLGSRLTGVLLLRDAEIQGSGGLAGTALVPANRRDTTAAFILIPQL